jgi:hypothetical protein
MEVIFLIVLYILESFLGCRNNNNNNKNRTKCVPEGPVRGCRGFYGALYQDLC